MQLVNSGHVELEVGRVPKFAFIGQQKALCDPFERSL